MTQAHYTAKSQLKEDLLKEEDGSFPRVAPVVMWGGGHCISNVTVYEDISRSDGQVNESNNQIYHFLALEKLSKNPPSDSFFHIENSEKNVPKDSHLRATF